MIESAQSQDVSIPSTGGVVLKARYWPRQEPRAIVVVAHGFGEHGGCYAHVAEALGTSLDVDFLAPDLRGHGRSPGRRGVVGCYEDLIDDVSAAVDWAAHERPDLPRYVLGHSNGGALTLRLGLRPSQGLQGLIVSNPSLRLATRVPAYKLIAGKFLLRHAPGVTLSAKLPAVMMTRDPEMQRDHETDPLRHSRISAPLFFGMVESGALIAEQGEQLQIPTLMLLGADDEVTSPLGSQEVFQKLGTSDKALIVYPEMRHEPFNEIGREQVFADVASWLEPRLQPVPVST